LNVVFSYVFQQKKIIIIIIIINDL